MRIRVLPLLLATFCTLFSDPLVGDTPETTVAASRRRFSAREVMEAFAKGYPDRIERYGFHRGDWGVLIDGEWFLYAEGRLLPEDLLFDEDYKPEAYASYPFYSYPANLPEIRNLDDSQVFLLKQRLESQRVSPPSRHPGLFNAIWRMDNRQEAWNRMKTIYFLGRRTLVHRDLLEDLAQVEEAIQELALINPRVREYSESIASVTGYNYRNIAGTRSLSFHSYGLAVDILPKTLNGRETYWRWAWDKGLSWYSLPYERRYMPPMEVVRIWEEHGFIWGGKWFFFDTMHVEYRPEILILNGLWEP